MNSERSELEAWWGKYGDHYNSRTWKDYRGLLSEFVRHAEGGPLLDVGCGYGLLVECARRFGIASIGLEGSETALARCKELHPLADVRPWRGGDDLPLESESVGGAILNEVIDHLTMHQNTRLFKELSRVLRVGGLLLVKSPSKANQFEQDTGHVTFFLPSEFRNFVTEFGFSVLEQPYVAKPVFGKSSLGLRLTSLVMKFYKPEKWAARIDLVARRSSE